MCQGTKRAAELASPIFVSQLRQHRSEVLLVFSCSIFFLLTSTPAASLHFSFPFEWRRPSTAHNGDFGLPLEDRSVCFFFSLCLCGPLAYFDNEHGKQLLYVFNDSVWDMKITVLEESADFVTLDTEKLFSKLKSHELSRKCHPNHDASFSSKALITDAHVGGHVTNSINTTNSSALEFALSSLCAASDEQYESIPDDEIALLVRKL
jgi:hypothetical protein